MAINIATTLYNRCDILLLEHLTGNAVQVLPWLLGALIFALPNGILTMGAIALNRERGYALAAGVGALVNIGLNIAWIPDYGARGAAWATVATVIHPPVDRKCRCRNLFPMDEEFGMSPVEAMAAGKPVIGVAVGGLLETVVPEALPCSLLTGFCLFLTGVLFDYMIISNYQERGRLCFRSLPLNWPENSNR